MKRIIILSILVFFFVSGSVFGILVANSSQNAYESQEEADGGANDQLKSLIIIGAGQFLKSHSDFQLFLNKVEMAELSGVNYMELQATLNSAIANMESAKTSYTDLKDLAAATPYNQSVISQLKGFPFGHFMAGRDFNPEIFRQLRGYLVRGDVTGAYVAIYSKVDDLLSRLHEVKHAIERNTFPRISGLWDLNQKYSNALFFGQYTAMIFDAITP